MQRTKSRYIKEVKAVDFNFSYLSQRMKNDIELCIKIWHRGREIFTVQENHLENIRTHLYLIYVKIWPYFSMQQVLISGKISVPPALYCFGIVLAFMKIKELNKNYKPVPFSSFYKPDKILVYLWAKSALK